MDLQSEESKLTRIPPKQKFGWRVCFHRNGSGGDRAEHCQLREYSNNGTTKESKERKWENGNRKKGKQKKGESKQGETRKWRNRREKEKGGEKRKTRKSRKQQERERKREETRGNERKREETSFARAISVQTARCWSALPKVLSLCVALCAFGNLIMVRKGWSVEDVLSKALWKRI